MSVYSSVTSRTSILKPYNPAERDKAKNAVVNKVRFQMPKQKGITASVELAETTDNYSSIMEYGAYLHDGHFDDEEFIEILNEVRGLVTKLGPKFAKFVAEILNLSWIKRSSEAVKAYGDVFIELMLTHCSYIELGAKVLVKLWLIDETTDAQMWVDGEPDAKLQLQLEAVHRLLHRLLSAVPMSYDSVLRALEDNFPYYKRPPHVQAGYVHNLLRLIQEKPNFTNDVLDLILKRLIIQDVNAPREEIENEEEKDSDDEMEEEASAMASSTAPKLNNNQLVMQHSVAEALDLCMNIFIKFLNSKDPNKMQINERSKQTTERELLDFFRQLLHSFERIVLPTHNSHHVQFLLFYICSFNRKFSDILLKSLWDKIKSPNESSVIRQASVSYLASFIARAKFVTIDTLKLYIQKLNNWAHEYQTRADEYGTQCSLKSCLVYYTVCQALFYIITFRQRQLLSDKQNIAFLTRLRLSALIKSHFNPLRVCLPAIAEAFANITSRYQLAYCHDILERNKRRKMATVYANQTATPEEVLDSYFPFDPCSLKRVQTHISAIYLEYQPCSFEETEKQAFQRDTNVKEKAIMRREDRKRTESEMLNDFDEQDDFMLSNKRLKVED